MSTQPTWPPDPSGKIRDAWPLDPGLVFLNHGSFGACPTPVLAVQQELRQRLERNPVAFLARDLPTLLDNARAELAAFVGADHEDLAFLPNTTHGVSAVLRSLALEPGAELLTTTHVYNACRNALHFVAERTGARVVVAEVPYPITEPREVVDAINAQTSPRTRLALIDHVTSPTGLIFPVAAICASLTAQGIETLIDGAHAPLMVDLDLRTLGATYYVANCHKWLCSPKGAAFLWVRRSRQNNIRPLAISHGATLAQTGRSRWQLEFDWTGTADPTASLCVPTALQFLASLLPGGLAELRATICARALAARHLLLETLGVDAPAPAAMIGSMATVPLPPDPAPNGGVTDPLQRRLLEMYRIESVVFTPPIAPLRVLRLSAHVYNCRADYERLAEALVDEGLRRF